jgi:uncharacterized protein YbjT (DUF2867 family)
MILIIGATGTIGRTLVAELLSGGAPVRALTRDPERARPLWQGDVELARGDFAEPASLASALAGVEALFLLSPAGPANPAHDLAVMEAVKGSRVSRVVKLSAFGVASGGPPTAAGWHAPGERAVIHSGRDWTLLRPAAFASNVLAWAAPIRDGQPIVLATGAGRHATIDPRDVAAVAARILTGRHRENAAYTLTGPEPLTAGEQVQILGRLLRRSLAVVEITPDAVADKMRTDGVPPAYADAVREGLTFVRDGHAAARTDAVEQILGRPPASFEKWAHDHLGLFR